MASTPSEGTTGDRPGYDRGGRTPDIARMGLPLNPELLVWLLVWAVIALIWLFSDEVGPGEFATLTVALTFAYLISLGIAKAGRVHERES